MFFFWGGGAAYMRSSGQEVLVKSKRYVSI